ncbi:GntR family transcriptional regulator [Psychrosphaera ytuae]|uniref:GntR family transcriptional regulator n=1 Tax=Psychrosphaera ytuae TaxID=2820710 RepID=A0A975HHQ3_9GAMM|nr:S1-like domain-containing RNA-binding protein [Psychrosphaera ytuae]QTH63421.1 GntR family transcriptional regulator [Psychrosphaera ytuae]
MIEVGKTNTLTVTKMMDFGAYLDGENLGEILLPRKHEPDNIDVGDELEVFVYLDSEDRPVATTQKPKVEVGQFAYLEVKDTNRVGAFLDWGLDKDLMVPYGEQHRPLEVGKKVLVYVYLDKIDQRPTASSKVDKFLQDENQGTFKPNQAVSLIIANSTDLGYKAIINHSHYGLLFKQDVFRRLSFGQSIKGFIKRIRQDGRIDLTLEGGKVTRDKDAEVIKRFLEKEGGFAAVHDKSDPELIKKLFGMSKGAFKKTIGAMYKSGDITIEKTGIRLTTEKGTATRD